MSVHIKMYRYSISNIERRSNVLVWHVSCFYTEFRSVCLSHPASFQPFPDQHHLLDSTSLELYDCLLVSPVTQVPHSHASLTHALRLLVLSLPSSSSSHGAVVMVLVLCTLVSPFLFKHGPLPPATEMNPQADASGARNVLDGPSEERPGREREGGKKIREHLMIYQGECVSEGEGKSVR